MISRWPWLALACFLLSADTSAHAATRIASATIATIDADARILGVRFTGESLVQNFEIEAKARVRSGRSSIPLTDLKEGQKVTIIYDSQDKTISSLRVTSATRAGDSRSMIRRRRSTKEEKEPEVEPAAKEEDVEEETQTRSSRRRPRSQSRVESSDWPQWRGPNQDGISTETGLLERWPENGLREVWSVPMGEGYSGVAVADGRVYTMAMADGQELVGCFDLQSGQREWVHSYNGAYSNGFGNGPRSTPTVDDGKVYSLGAKGHLHCLDARTGDVEWMVPLLERFNAENIQWGISASPLVVNDLVLVNPGGRNGNSIVAFEKNSGRVRWKGLNDKAGYATPLAFQIDGMDVVAFFTGEALVGVEPQRGQELFRYPWRTEYDCNIATPIYADGCLFISSDYGTGCAAIDVARRGNRVSIDERFRNREMKNHFSTCIHHEGHVYGFDSGIFACVDLKNGQTKWSQRGFRKGSLTMADGKLIVLGEQGKLALVNPSPERYEEISSFNALDGKCWTVPVVAQGKLFVRNESVLRCFDLRSP